MHHLLAIKLPNLNLLKQTIYDFCEVTPRHFSFRSGDIYKDLKQKPL